MFNPELQGDGWAPVQSFRCVECGHINEDMDPAKTLLYTEDSEVKEEV